MGLNLQGLVGALPRVTKDIADIAQALTGALGGGAPAAQQPAVAQRPADQFQAPAATQQAAANGTPAQFGQVINQIMDALKQIVTLLGGGQAGQAQAPAVGAGAGGAAPAQTGGAAPAPAGGQNAVGGPQVQGGQGTLPAAQPQAGAGVNNNLLLHGVGTTLVGLGEICQAIAGGKGAGQPGSPNPGDAGGLSASADAKSITTSGGYKIQCDGANAWSITGPDGKPVKVDGDPHVHEDGVNFDFKKDSSFVLPDGTKVNCKTKDLGNGTSVSDQLEVVKDGQRATLDVSKGDGKVTAVDRGPEQFHTDQTFTMGADGKFGINGKTITGSQGADNFQTGGDQQLTQQATAAANAGAAAGAGGAQQGGLAGLANQIQQLLAALGGGQAAQGTQAAAGGNEAGQQAPVQNQPAAQPPAQDAAAKPQDMVSQLLQAIMGMLNALMPLLGNALKGQGGAPA